MQHNRTRTGPDLVPFLSTMHSLAPVTAAPPRRHRILVLTPRPPYPPIGGDRLRIYNLCRELSRHHELTLLSLHADDEVPVAPPTEVFARAEFVRLPRWRSVLNVLGALVSGEALQLAYYRSGPFRARVEALLPGHDLVLCHLIRTAPYVLDATLPRVLEMTDAISLSMQRAASVPPLRFDPRRAIYRLEAQRLRAAEQRIARRFDLVSLISEVDRRHLFGPEDPDHARVMVVPNGATETLVPGTVPGVTTELAFIGNLYTLQNLDALWFFVLQVLPGLRLRHPATVLRVIGPVREAEAKRLSANAGVRVLGLVDDLGAALAGAAIGICPVRIGAGMQNKILDYMAHGLATVTSPVGLEGLHALPGEHLEVANSPADWIASLERLIRDPLRLRRMGDSGRGLVATRYRWEVCIAPLVESIGRMPLKSARKEFT